MIQTDRPTSLSPRLALAAALVLVLAAGCGTARHDTGSEVPECLRCHGAPPATGAHQAHVAFLDLPTLAYGEEWRTEDLDPSGAQGAYSFGCGSCHPRDPAKHINGTVDVDVSSAGAAPGGLTSRNGGATYAGGSCSGVYCHSDGRAQHTATPTPAWTSGVELGCGGCHGNPPSYANGGPDGAANSHIFLNWYGYEGGHFAPLPGTFHRSRHGGSDTFGAADRAAPMTCQACHADTVDPANVAAGGLFYLDTSITTRLAGGDPRRLADPAWRDTQCASCHDGAPGSPPQGTGKVRPARHVNGARDVAFDRRATAPAGYFATPGDPLRPDLGGSAPTRPYFTTSARFPFGAVLPAGAGFDPAPPAGFDHATLSFELSQATYVQATLTCSSVACHLGQSVRWGQKDFETAQPTCTGCHPMQ